MGKLTLKTDVKKNVGDMMSGVISRRGITKMAL